MSGPMPTDASAQGDPLASAQPSPLQRTRPIGRRILLLGMVVAVMLAAAFTLSTVPRLRHERALNTEAAAAASRPPRVVVTAARQTPAEAERVLPGNVLPLLDASIYARTTGYLARRLVDIGDRVEEGQLLAEISAPDVDDQLAQARADLALARANLPLAEANAELAKATLTRYLEAEPGVAVSLLQIDEQRAMVKTTQAQVEATKASIQVNEATVQRFTDLQNFEKVTAPFKGVITARTIDQGDLITADTPSTTKELFHLMRTDIVRVFIDVPQVFATSVTVGQSAVVYLRNDPQRQYTGTVTRTADALNPGTRTLLTEVQVANPDNLLRPGMYLQVKLVFRRDTTSVRIPRRGVGDPGRPAEGGDPGCAASRAVPHSPTRTRLRRRDRSIGWARCGGDGGGAPGR